MIEITPTTPAATAAKQRQASSFAPARALGQGIVNLALVILAVRDIRRRRADEINGNRKIWRLAAFAPPVGPIAYFLFGRKRGAQTAEVPLEITEKP
jgi:hypothetical protein